MTILNFVCSNTLFQWCKIFVKSAQIQHNIASRYPSPLC